MYTLFSILSFNMGRQTPENCEPDFARFTNKSLGCNWTRNPIFVVREIGPYTPLIREEIFSQETESLKEQDFLISCQSLRAQFLNACCLMLDACCLMLDACLLLDA